jgi:ribosome-associated protein
MIYQKIYDAVLNTKGFDIVIYDIRTHSSEMDFVVIASANSKAHIQGICQNVKKDLKKLEITPYAIEGDRDSSWVLMDYSDTLLHLMTLDMREKYNLEELYKKYFQAPKISLPHIVEK